MSIALAAFAGLFVGSALTMLVDRVPDHQPLSTGPRCPFCDHGLGPADLVPVISWARQHGRCRYCEHPITPAYPAVELLTAAAFAAVVAEFGVGWITWPYLVVVSALIAASVIDLYLYIIPNRIVFPAFAATLVLMVAASLALDSPEHIWRALAGAGLYFLLLFIPHLISPRGMGFGDVKLALLMGLALAWRWVPLSNAIVVIVWSLLIGAFIGIGGGLLLAIARRVSQRNVLADPLVAAGADVSTVPMLSQTFPFGPALAASTMVGIFYGDVFLA